MAPAARTYVYIDDDGLDNALSASGVDLRLDDDSGGTISAAEETRRTQAKNAASETVDFYCFDRYTQANLYTSNFVYEAAKWLAAYELCATRGNEVPESVVEQAERWEEKLKAIHAGRARLPGIPMRMSQAPAWDNVRVDKRFDFKAIRVEKKTSSQTPTTMPVQTDYQAEWTWEI